MVGFYDLVGQTSLGTEVRVSLHIRLVNHSDERLFITKLGLRGSLRPEQIEEESAAVIIEPHGSVDFTQEFILAQNRYEHWRTRVRPLLLLNMQLNGGDERPLSISLLRKPAMSAQW